MVRMAEYAVSARPGARLVSLGLGSCIGCAIVDPTAGVAGLAHIVLPESWSAGKGGQGQPAKFADTAVPLLLEKVLGLGARRGRLQAVLCGGAQMFPASSGRSSGLEIGRRNHEGTLAALREARVPVRGSSVGGSSGRSVDVDVATGAVTVRAVGQAVESL
jgi:chemotaxis protein CheD